MFLCCVQINKFSCLDQFWIFLRISKVAVDCSVCQLMKHAHLTCFVKKTAVGNAKLLLINLFQKIIFFRQNGKFGQIIEQMVRKCPMSDCHFRLYSYINSYINCKSYQI